MAAGWALIGDQFQQRADARHVADWRQGFAAAGAVRGQILKLYRHTAKMAVKGNRNNYGKLRRGWPAVKTKRD